MHDRGGASVLGCDSGDVARDVAHFLPSSFTDIPAGEDVSCVTPQQGTLFHKVRDRCVHALGVLQLVTIHLGSDLCESFASIQAVVHMAANACSSKTPKSRQVRSCASCVKSAREYTLDWGTEL